MRTVYALVAVVLVAGLALAGCCGNKKDCPPGHGHAAGDACCAAKAPATPAAQ